MQEELRKKVKMLKALQDISYLEIAEYLEINKNSFYNWLKGYYNLSADNTNRLIDIINTITE